MAISAEAAYDEENSEKFASAYMATQKDLYTKENLEFVSKYTRSSQSKGFELMLKDPEKVDAVLGKGKSNEILSAVVLEENIYPGLRKPNANIDSLITATQAKYPTVDISKTTELIKIQVFHAEKKWDKFQPALLSYMKKYGAEVRADMLNIFASEVIENCKHTHSITDPLRWIKSTFDENQTNEPA